MTNLQRTIDMDEEREFDIRSRDFYRPPLKQLGSSLYEIRTHYMSQGHINVVPIEYTTHLSEIRDTLLKHLVDNSFLYKNNIVTGSTIQQTDDQGRRLPSLVVLMNSLALAMDIEISPRPSDVQCDILLAICGQPVIVLTLVDGDKDSDTVEVYNTSVAVEITSKLLTFMDESINIVSGVICSEDLETKETFHTAIISIAVKSAFFVTLSSLATTPSKYEKIVTAFWAGVAQSNSVMSGDGRVDTDYLRFLTKDQCIILLENINKKEVQVEFHSGTGATTLMMEVTRRLSKLQDTLLVCGSQEEKERLRSVYPDIKTAASVNQGDMSRYASIVDETGTVTAQFRGSIWRFSRVYSELEELQHNVDMFKKEVENKQKMIYLLSSVSRQDKMDHLSRETETLKLIDIICQRFIEACHLPSSSLAYELFPVKHEDDEGSSDRQLEEREYVNDLLCQLKHGMQEKNDMFPILGSMVKQARREIPYLEAKTKYLESVTSGSVYLDNNQTDKLLVQRSSVHESTTHVIRASDEQKTDSTNSQNTKPVADSVKMMKLKERREHLEKDALSLEGDLRQLPQADAYCVEWEDTMQYLSRELSTINMRYVITSVIGDEPIPAFHYDIDLKQTSHLESDHSIGRLKIQQCHVHHLRNLQYGTLRRKKIMDILRDVITNDQRRLSSLRTQSDHLEHFYGSPVYIVGEIDTDRSSPVASPAMTLNSELVNWHLAVRRGTELINKEGSGPWHHPDRQFQRHQGTISNPIEIELSTSLSTLSIPRYWETFTRLEVIGNVPLWEPLLEMGVAEEGQLDTENWLSGKNRIWAVRVGSCNKHLGICTQVWGEIDQVGNCIKDTMSAAPGTVATLRFGISLDVKRGKMAFYDVKRRRVLHNFDIKFRQTLYPVFSVGPHMVNIEMQLVSGRKIAGN